MSDDLGTVNLRRGERGREIEILRQHYRRHRELLEKLSADAPTEHLASEYHRIAQSIDASLQKLDELERGQAPAAATAAAAAAARGRAAAPPVNPNTQPAMRPLQPHPALRHLEEDVADEGSMYEGGERPRGSRTALIAVAGLLALALVAWLIWRSSSDRDVPPLVTDTETVAPAEPDSTIEPVAPPAGVSVTPDAQNYGLIRKGTRATRQFEIANPSDQPLSVQVARSSCRCLFYEYVDTIAPKSKESLTVTVDGHRAKAGELRETIKISSKKDPTMSTSFEVVANIQ